MIIRRFTWAEPAELAAGLRQWFGEAGREVDVGPIEAEVAAGGDAALMRLTARFDATEAAPPELRVDLSQAESSLEAADDDVVAAGQVRDQGLRGLLHRLLVGRRTADGDGRRSQLGFGPRCGEVDHDRERS